VDGGNGLQNASPPHRGEPAHLQGGSLDRTPEADPYGGVIERWQAKIETRKSKLKGATFELAAEFPVSNFEFRSLMTR
jgi:hypothetical protein